MLNRKTLFIALPLLIIVIAVLVLINVVRSKGFSLLWQPPNQQRVILPNAYFEEIRSPNVYVVCKTCLSAQNQAIYMVGSQRQNGSLDLIKLNLLSGQTDWEQPLLAGRVTTMWLDSYRIYIGFEGNQKIGSDKQVWGTSRVIAFETSSGEQLWGSRIPGSNDIVFLSAAEDTIFVVGNTYLKLVKLEANTGQQMASDDRAITLFESNDVVYQNSGSEIRAFHAKTGQLIWQQNQPFRNFIYTDNALIIKTDTDLGAVKAIDVLSGEILWEQVCVISNIAASNGTVFLITIESENGFCWGSDSVADASLLAIDEKTGKVITTLSFAPSEVRSNSGQSSYNVAASNDNILVYFDDTKQLFVLRFIGDS